MRVICRECRGLIPEDEAIKMSELEYNLYSARKLAIDWCGFVYDSQNNQMYTQICEECYKKSP